MPGLLSLWVFTMLVLVWAAVFIAAPTIGATFWAFRLGIKGRVALGVVALFVYCPALTMFGLYCAAAWDRAVGWPPA